jgi:DNA-binding FadR family transcriptional regulator
MNPQASPVHVPKAAALVADALRARVVRRELVPGDRLPSESLLMRQYGVSRPTLREALRLLEAAELLEVRRGAHGGGVIRAPSAAPAIEALTSWLLLGHPAAPAHAVERVMEIAAAALEAAVEEIEWVRPVRAA